MKLVAFRGGLKMSYDWRKDLNKPVSIGEDYKHTHSSSSSSNSKGLNSDSDSVTKKDIEDLKATTLLTALLVNEQNSRCPWGIDISEGFNFYCALIMFATCGIAGFFIFFIL